MKRILLLLLLITIPILVFGQEEKVINNKDVFLKDTLFYHKQDTTLVNGKLVRYHSNGLLRMASFVENGKLNGIMKEWYNDGGLRREVFINDNLMNGPYKSWNEKGDLIEEGQYADNKKVGGIEARGISSSI